VTEIEKEISKPHEEKVSSDANSRVCTESAVSDTSQQAVLTKALESNVNNIPEGDSVGQHLAALRPGMTLSEAKAAQQQVEMQSFELDFGDGKTVTAKDKGQTEKQIILAQQPTSDVSLDQKAETKAEFTLPESEQEWKLEINKFDEFVKDKLHLKHEPTHEDYGRMVNDPTLSREFALDASLLFAFGMRDRGSVSRETFANDRADAMLAKASSFKLIPASPNEMDSSKISQGYPNDCTSISTFMFMTDATEGRDALRKMVTVNPRARGALHDSYTVVLPGDPQHPIVVNGLTESEKMLAVSSGTDDIYLAVIEKALGQYCNERSSLSKKVVMSEAVTFAMGDPVLGWVNGTSYHDPIELISGNKIQEINSDAWFDEGKKAALSAYAEGRMVLIGVKAPPPPEHSKASILRKHPNHAYVMRSCDGDGIVLRNPVDDDPREFKLSWDELRTGTSCLLVASKDKRK